MNAEVKQFWSTMMGQDRKIRGYSEIALRMLWKVCTDGRLFRRFVNLDEEPKKERPPGLKARDRYLIRIGVLRNLLNFERDRNERKQIQSKISYCKRMIRMLDYQAEVRADPVRMERLRRYQREYKRRHRAALKNKN